MLITLEAASSRQYRPREASPFLSFSHVQSLSKANTSGQGSHLLETESDNGIALVLDLPISLGCGSIYSSCICLFFEM